MTYKILIVDDESANLRVLDRLFRENHSVLTATSGKEGLELLLLHDVALIISDQRMPAMTGIEFLKKAAELRPQTVRIILTGYTDAATLVEAINSGVVYKYITKPWINDDLKLTVSRGLEHYESMKSQHLMTLENLRLTGRLRATVDAFVNLATSVVDLRNPGRGAHASRVSLYSRALGSQLGFETDELERLSVAALLHESPEALLPPEIMDRESGRYPSTSRDFDAAIQLLGSVPDLADVSDVVGCVHERFGGGGFPSGLAGAQIPLHARIIAVADAYDEFRSPQYDSELDHAEAQQRIQDDSGRQFDPAVTEHVSCLEWVNRLIQTELTSHELAGVLSL